jgi:hypothetical protein
MECLWLSPVPWGSDPLHRMLCQTRRPLDLDAHPLTGCTCLDDWCLSLMSVARWTRWLCTMGTSNVTITNLHVSSLYATTSTPGWRRHSLQGKKYSTYSFCLVLLISSPQCLYLFAIHDHFSRFRPFFECRPLFYRSLPSHLILWVFLGADDLSVAKWVSLPHSA